MQLAVKKNWWLESGEFRNGAGLKLDFCKSGIAKMET